MGWAEESALSAVSPVEAVPVLELYTSHGCSSCPPADRWLRGFADRDNLWAEVVPLAFHVDYWDWIGWKDRFADPGHTERQKTYRRFGALRSVYTPGFVLNGREWKGWFSGQELPIEPGPPVGRLSIQGAPGKGVSVEFSPHRLASDSSLIPHLAVLGFGLASAIGAGENSGRTLEEDFVVLGATNGIPRKLAPMLKWHLDWPDLVSADTARRSVVVWISREEDPTPLQAVGSWLHTTQKNQ